MKYVDVLIIGLASQVLTHIMYSTGTYMYDYISLHLYNISLFIQPSLFISHYCTGLYVHVYDHFITYLILETET